MLSIILFLLISVANTQYYSQQRQYPSNNYNSWSSFSSWNQGIQQQQQPNRAVIRGNLLSDDINPLPIGSKIIVSVADVALQDVASNPLNSFILYGSYRFPIAYEIPYSLPQSQTNTFQQYAIQARIEKDGQLLYINDQYTPVRLIPPPINPINIIMKKVGGSIYPGINGGIYTTRPPSVSGIYICQLRADPGTCYASIEQFYFNTLTRQCETFLWGGCGGNQNRFPTRDACERTCATYRRRRINNNAKHKWMG